MILAARSAWAGAVLLLLAQSPSAWAFKIRTHVYTANIAAADIVDGAAYFPGMVSVHAVNTDIMSALGIPNASVNPKAAMNSVCGNSSSLLCSIGQNATLKGREIPIGNDELRHAVFKYPQMMRAGAIGPDGFPDLIWGQFIPHVNHGRYPSSWVRQRFGKDKKTEFYSGLPFGLDQPSSSTSRRTDDPFTWRSIDHGIYLLSKAYNYYPTAQPGTNEYELRLQALAFTYGYLQHMSGDAFAHAFVNRQAGDFWQYTEGKGPYGRITEELKHFAIEDWIEIHFSEQVFSSRRRNFFSVKYLVNQISPFAGFYTWVMSRYTFAVIHSS